MENALDSGKILAKRYRILYALSQDNVGRTYLAEIVDSESGDRRILQEIGDRLASSLLEHHADRLRQNFKLLQNLDHPQLPHFQDLLHVESEKGDRLIIVQDYIEGLTYRELLNARQQQGRSFSEADIRELLQNTLPVLSYLHEHHISHGNICPESLILRHQDRLPVLTHFGSLPWLLLTQANQLTAATSSSHPSAEVTAGMLLPRGDRADDADLSPQNDFSALAITALMLLSGREPQYLKNPQTQAWDWSYLRLTPEFQQILQQMLGEGDRADNADTLLNALNACPPPIAATPITPYTAIDPPTSPTGSYRFWSWGAKAILAVLFCLVSGIMGWFAGKAWIDAQVPEPATPSPSRVRDRPEPEPDISPEALSFPPTGDLEPEPNSDLSPAEQERQQAIRDRRLGLGIDYSFFTALVDRVFEQRYPEPGNRELTNRDEDARWRSQKADIANEMLNKLTSLSSETRFELGNYDRGDRQGMIRTANNLRLSSRAVYDLTDGAFNHTFPDWAEADYDAIAQLDEPMGQVWQAFMAEQIRSLENGMALQERQFLTGISSDRISGTLQPGEGQAIVLELTANQIFDVFLNASSDILISFYSPSGNQIFLEDARDRNWNGDLPESGYYEMTLVSTSPQPLDYSLSLAVSEPLESQESEF